MARNIQQMQIGGQTVWVEVDETVAMPPAPDARFANTSANGGGNAAVAAIRKVDIGDTLTAVLAPVQAAFEKLKPEEVSIELTLGFKADASVFIASSEGSAQIKVSAKWKPTRTA